MEATQKCQNCGKQFPESKINSHFSYCRRNIKKCAQCGQMVDINYMEQHNNDFHTKQACKYCKKQMVPQELTKHQNTCTSKPKYCQYCENNIPANEFDRHVGTCGSRTKLCAKCEKNIILRDYDVHSVTCRGKTVSPPPIHETVPRPFQKKPTDVRRQVPPASYGVQPKPDPYPYRAERIEVPTTTNVRKPDPPVFTNANKGGVGPTNPVSGVRSSSNNPPSSMNVPAARVDSRGREVRKQEKRPSYQQPAQNIPPTNQRVQPSRPEPIRQPVRQEPQRQDPTRARRQQPQSSPFYEQQRQYLKQQQRQKQSRPQPPPVYEAPYIPPEAEPHEDAELQKAIYQSMGLNKLGGQMKNLDLGMDHMSQSFYRDLQLQEKIEASIKAEKQPRRR